MKLSRLKAACEQAIAAKEARFTVQGREFLTASVKHLIEYACDCGATGIDFTPAPDRALRARATTHLQEPQP